MKTVFAFLVLFISLGSLGQSKKDKVFPDALEWTIMPNITDTIWLRGDTIVIPKSAPVHYIVIGQTVYKITEHDPTLDKVEPIQQTRRWPFQTPYYFGDNMPMYRIDSLGNLVSPMGVAN